MAQNPELQFQETISDHCNLCGSLKKRDLITSDHCTLCGYLKKRDSTTSDDASGDGQPQLKKRETASVHDCSLHGFTMVSVPPPNSYHCLSRTSSDLINSPGLDQPKQPSLENFPHSPQAPRMNPKVSTPSPSPVKGAPAELPPLPPLRRSVSEPLPVTSPPRTGVMPCGHGEMGTVSQAMFQESPDAERFKKIVEKIKEMKQWCQEVALEVEDIGSHSHHNNTSEASNAETEEEVSIERVGESLRIYLKCPCSKAYQLLISGSNCYYKLL